MKTASAVVGWGVLAVLNVLVAWAAYRAGTGYDDLDSGPVMLLAVANAAAFAWALRSALARHIEARALQLAKESLEQLNEQQAAQRRGGP
jgi:hypothetical protein